MHLGTKALMDFYQSHREAEALVLVTITGTEGSTYRKPGAMMLISPDHEYVGLISGGCLEGDLLHHADAVFRDGQPRSLTYDMHAGDDLVFSLGIGCDGIIHLLLQKLTPDADFAWLDALDASLQGGEAVMLAVVHRSQDEEFPIGSMGMVNRHGISHGNDGLVDLCVAESGMGWPQWRTKDLEHATGGVLLVNIPPQPRILICGAGVDAVPVARQFLQLGWDCLVADHRESFAQAGRFGSGCRFSVGRPEGLAERCDLERLDAALIMSHHLENDAAYLRQLAPLLQSGSLCYLGVLGPAARRFRLKEMAECPDAPVYGPVGLDIGAELPESIALSVAAEVHAVLNGRDGRALTAKLDGS